MRHLSKSRRAGGLLRKWRLAGESLIGARSRARDDDPIPLFRSERLEPRMLLSVDVTGLPDWVSQGPGPIKNGAGAGVPDQPIAGGVNVIAVEPGKAKSVYVGTSDGGVWHTDDITVASPHWLPLTEHFPSLAISALAFDP